MGRARYVGKGEDAGGVGNEVNLLQCEKSIELTQETHN